MSRATFLAEQANALLGELTHGLLMLQWDAEQDERSGGEDALRHAHGLPTDDVQGGQATLVLRVGEAAGFVRVIRMGEVWLVPRLLDLLREGKEYGVVWPSPDENNVWPVLALLEECWVDRHPGEALKAMRLDKEGTED